jgi:hypothetical protein
MNVPYDYYFLPLTLEESKKGECIAWGYVLKNKDRWIDVCSSDYELQTYDKGYTRVVIGDNVYTIHEDYIYVAEKKRVFVGKFYDVEEDKIITDEEEETVKPTIFRKDQYDYFAEKRKTFAEEMKNQETSEEATTEESKEASEEETTKEATTEESK